MSNLNEVIKFWQEQQRGRIWIKFNDQGYEKSGFLHRVGLTRDLQVGGSVKTIDIEMRGDLPSTMTQKFIQTIQPEQVIEADIVL